MVRLTTAAWRGMFTFSRTMRGQCTCGGNVFACLGRWGDGDDTGGDEAIFEGFGVFLVSLGEGFEAFLGFGIGVDIWMQFAREQAV